MQRRRERIERWRQERKKTAELATAKAEEQLQAEAVAQSSGKKWSLEDDDDADDEAEEEVSLGWMRRRPSWLLMYEMSCSSDNSFSFIPTAIFKKFCFFLKSK